MTTAATRNDNNHTQQDRIKQRTYESQRKLYLLHHGDVPQLGQEEAVDPRQVVHVVDAAPVLKSRLRYRSSIKRKKKIYADPKLVPCKVELKYGFSNFRQTMMEFTRRNHRLSRSSQQPCVFVVDQHNTTQHSSGKLLTAKMEACGITRVSPINMHVHRHASFSDSLGYAALLDVAVLNVFHARGGGESSTY